MQIRILQIKLMCHLGSKSRLSFTVDHTKLILLIQYDCNKDLSSEMIFCRLRRAGDTEEGAGLRDPVLLSPGPGGL